MNKQVENISGVNRYNKRPKAVEAIQFDGTELGAKRIYDWLVSHDQQWDADIDEDSSLCVMTAHGGFFEVEESQWVVRNNKGILSICLSGIFEATYLEAQDDTA